MEPRPRMSSLLMAAACLGTEIPPVSPTPTSDDKCPKCGIFARRISSTKTDNNYRCTCGREWSEKR